jgi:transcriptional regulator with XRE-family HTH domain
MSILAKNLKTIRKELRCTQASLAEIMSVGFRTYVRYEAGERDAPVSVLVKLARLGSMSLEQLLTVEIHRSDVLPNQAFTRQSNAPEVKKCDFRTGLIEFKKPVLRGLLSLDDVERKLLLFFRKMDLGTQTDCLESLKKMGKGSRATGKADPVRIKKSPGKPKLVFAKGQVTTDDLKAKLDKVGKKKKPGRKKLDRKVLKEKIDKLKLLTKSIKKITVR